MYYVFAWTDSNEKALERNVPMLWHGNYLLSKKWENKITLVFLEGMELLSQEYLARLSNCGYVILDGSNILAEELEHHPELKSYRKLSRYWFLRWNVMHRLMLEKQQTNAIHIDGDVVFMDNPEVIASDVAGKTFVLQGCPAFASISNLNWFEVWQHELSLFLSNPHVYMNNACSVKAQNHDFDRTVCNQSAYSSRFFEDQDLIQYLIASKKLPQEKTDVAFGSSFYWMQNPLYPTSWIFEQEVATSEKFKVAGIHHKIGRRKIALYHFQTDFSIICQIWLLLRTLRIPQFIRYFRPSPISIKLVEPI